MVTCTGAFSRSIVAGFGRDFRQNLTAASRICLEIETHIARRRHLSLERKAQFDEKITDQIRRRTGHSITIPVWFVFEENTLWLLPVYTS
jgi:hypothetical protein